MLQVVDEDLVDGVIRCHVGKDSSPRGVAVHNLGWVTAAKDGELKVDTNTRGLSESKISTKIISLPHRGVRTCQQAPAPKLRRSPLKCLGH